MNMSGPTWLADGFAAVMLVVAAYSAGRLVASRVLPRLIHVDVDVVHVLMGVGMAGMFVKALNPIPFGAWEVVFSAVAAWFVWRCIAYVSGRDARRRLEDHLHHVSHYPTHVVMAFAMLYMYLAPSTGVLGTTGGGMNMGGGVTASTADFVGLPLLFLVVLLASGVWELDRADRFRRARPVLPEPVPALAFAVARTSAEVSGAGASTDLSFARTTAASTRPHDDAWMAPGLMAASHVAMCIAMGYMLIVML